MSSIQRPPLLGSRGHTTEIWDHIHHGSIAEDPHYGVHERIDFTKDVAGFTQTALNSGSSTFALIDGVGGMAEVDPGATTIQHGRQGQYGAANVGVFSDGWLAFETLFKLTLNSTEPFWFLGLCEMDTTILSASSLLTTDGIGFQVANADGHVDFIARKDGSDTLTEIVSSPLVADEWYHAGFLVKPGGPAIPFWNSVEQSSDLRIANSALPTDPLAMSFAFCGQGTIRPTMVFDWMEVALQRQWDVR